MAYQNIAVDRPAEGIGRITLDRPDKRNPMFPQTLAELLAALDELGRDESLICLILAARGKAFIGGADVNTLARLDALGMRSYITQLCDVMRKIESVPQPVIAAVQGICLGAGPEVVAACDFAIASESARFAMPEAAIGLPSVIHAALFPHYASIGRVREWLYTGDEIDAHQAEHWGFVNRVVPDDRLEAEVLTVAQKIAAKGALPIRLQKELMTKFWLRSDLEASINDSINLVALPYAAGLPQQRAQAVLDQLRARKSAGAQEGAGAGEQGG